MATGIEELQRQADLLAGVGGFVGVGSDDDAVFPHVLRSATSPCEIAKCVGMFVCVICKPRCDLQRSSKRTRHKCVTCNVGVHLRCSASHAVAVERRKRALAGRVLGAANR